MYEITKENWRSHLIINSSGDGLEPKSIQNAILVLSFSQEQFGRFKNHEGKVVTDGGKWRAFGDGFMELTDDDIISLQAHLGYAGLRLSKENIRHVIEVAANYHEANND